MLFTFPTSSYRIWLREICVHGFSQVIPCNRKCPTSKLLLVLLQKITCYLHHKSIIQIQLAFREKQKVTNDIYIRNSKQLIMSVTRRGRYSNSQSTKITSEGKVEATTSMMLLTEFWFWNSRRKPSVFKDSFGQGPFRSNI